MIYYSKELIKKRDENSSLFFINLSTVDSLLNQYKD